MVPASVVHDDHHRATAPSPTQQLAKKQLKRLRIERLGRHRQESPVARTNRTEHCGLLARRRVQQHRIDILGRDPHGAA